MFYKFNNLCFINQKNVYNIPKWSIKWDLYFCIKILSFYATSINTICNCLKYPSRVPGLGFRPFQPRTSHYVDMSNGHLYVDMSIYIKVAFFFVSKFCKVWNTPLTCAGVRVSTLSAPDKSCTYFLWFNVVLFNKSCTLLFSSLKKPSHVCRGVLPN